MESVVPKQFLLLKGKPILHYSIEAFFQHDPSTALFVVVSKEELKRWENLCVHYPVPSHQIVVGGETRTQSVWNGLKLLPSEGLVAIHDGARPLVSSAIIEKCFQAASLFGSGVASIKSKDSLRLVLDSENQALDREHVRLIQTPQTFQNSFIKDAFDAYGTEASSDDATIAQRAGLNIQLVEGSYHNFKITTAEDLIFAEAILSQE